MATIRREAVDVDPLASLAAKNSSEYGEENEEGSDDENSNELDRKATGRFSDDEEDNGEVRDSSIDESNSGRSIPPPPMVPPPVEDGNKSTDVLSLTSSPSNRPRPPVVDVIEVMSQRFLSRCKTKPIDIYSIEDTIFGLQLFASANAWKHVLSLTSRLMSLSNNPYEEGFHDLLLSFRLESCFRLKLFDELSVDISRVLDVEERKADNSVSDIVNKSCVKVNWDAYLSTSLLFAQTRSNTGRGELALEKLYQLKAKLLPVLDNVCQGQSWLWRLQQGIVNLCIRLRFWRLAIKELESMLLDMDALLSKSQNMISRRTVQDGSSDLNEECVKKEEEENSTSFPAAPALSNAEEMFYYERKIELLCFLSRVFLQMGNVKSCQKYYRLAIENYCQYSECRIDGWMDQLSHEMLRKIDCEILMCHGLIKFGMNEYDEALETFNKIMQWSKTLSWVTSTINSNNSAPGGESSQSTDSIFSSPFDCTKGSEMVDSSYSTCGNEISLTSCATLVIGAVNNYAVCCLYLKRIKDGIAEIENIICENPAMFFYDGIVFNLCTLYELSGTPDLSTNKKKALQRVALAYHMEDPIISWKSFRL